MQDLTQPLYSCTIEFNALPAYKRGTKRTGPRQSGGRVRETYASCGVLYGLHRVGVFLGLLGAVGTFGFLGASGLSVLLRS